MAQKPFHERFGKGPLPGKAGEKARAAQAAQAEERARVKKQKRIENASDRYKEMLARRAKQAMRRRG